jgi:hypothetical protein
MVKNFPAQCRFGAAPFDLLVNEVLKMKFQKEKTWLLIYL